jgi:hypothetical protein
MREIITETDIAAAPEKVWAILTDFARYSEWNPFITSAQGEPSEGARLKVRIEPPGGTAMTFRPRLTRVRRGKELRWLGHVFIPGLFDGEHIFEIEPRGDGGVRLRQRERFRGILVPLLWRGMHEKTRRGFEAMNASLKRRAEVRD